MCENGDERGCCLVLPTGSCVRMVPEGLLPGVADIFKSQVDEQGKMPQASPANNNDLKGPDLPPKTDADAQEGGCAC